MLRKWLVLVGLVFVGVLAGCNKDDAAHRDEFAGVMTTDDGKALIPVSVPDRKGDAILGAIAASAEPAKAEGGKAGGEAEQAEEVKVDDSSAQAMADSLIAIVKAGDFAKLPDVVPPDQKESMGKMVAAYGSHAKAARDLKLALDEKFPDNQVMASMFPISQTLGGLVSAEVKVGEVKAVNDEEATASFMVGPEATAKKIELSLKKFDQTWRVVLPDFTPPPDIEGTAKLDEGKDKALEDIAKRVQSGDLKDVESVQTQLNDVAAGNYKLSAPAEGEGSADKANEEKAAEQPKPKKAQPKKSNKQAQQQPRERDAVDDVVSSPVLPR